MTSPQMQNAPAQLALSEGGSESYLAAGLAVQSSGGAQECGVLDAVILAGRIRAWLTAHLVDPDQADDVMSRLADVITDAACWRTYTSPDEIARRLRAELEWEEPAVWTPEIVAEVRRTADRPTFAELCDRRGEHERAAEARQSTARLREVA